MLAYIQNGCPKCGQKVIIKQKGDNYSLVCTGNYDTETGTLKKGCGILIKQADKEDIQKLRK